MVESSILFLAYFRSYLISQTWGLLADSAFYIKAYPLNAIIYVAILIGVCASYEVICNKQARMYCEKLLEAPTAWEDGNSINHLNSGVIVKWNLTKAICWYEVIYATVQMGA